MYTASFAFFEALCGAGVSHCFVNLGSDHPSIIEAILKGQRDGGSRFPRVITCPSEVGFARSLSRYMTNLLPDGSHVNGRWLRACDWEAAMRHCTC